MKDSIVPKAIGFLTNNFISSNKYRREKRDYPRWSNKEREGKREKLFQFSFKRVCTSILCALTVVQYLFLSRTIIAIETLVQEEEEDKKKKESLVSLFEKSDIRPKNVIIIHIIILNVANLTYYILVVNSDFRCTL